MLLYFRKTLRELYYNKKGLLILLLALVGVVVLSFAVSESTTQKGNVITIGVVDSDQSAYSGLLVQYFGESEEFTKFSNVIIGTEEQMKERFEKGEMVAYLHIPKGFAENLINVINTPIYAAINNEDTTISLIIRTLLESYEEYIASVQINCVSIYDLLKYRGMEKEELRNHNMQSSIQLITTALARDQFFEKHELEEIPQTSIAEYYMWALLSLVPVLMGLFAGHKYLKEVNHGTFLRIRIIGNSVLYLTLSIIFTYTLLTMLLCQLVVTLFQMGLKFPLTMSFYAFFFPVSLLATTVGCLAAQICRSKKTYMIVSNLTVLIFCILGGIAVPIIFIPESILRLSRFVPNYILIKSYLYYKNGNNLYEFSTVLLFAVMVCAGSVFILYRLLTKSMLKIKGESDETV